MSEHVHDFYKPEFEHYPRVHGKLSQDCYLRALKECLSSLQTWHGKGETEETDEMDTHVDHWLFHAPYAKLVRKAHAQVYEMERKRKRERQTTTTTTEQASDFERRVSRGLDVCRVGSCTRPPLRLPGLLPACNRATPRGLFYGAGYVRPSPLRVAAVPGAEEFAAALDARRQVRPEVYDAAMAGVDGPWTRRRASRVTVDGGSGGDYRPGGGGARLPLLPCHEEEDGEEDVLILVDSGTRRRTLRQARATSPRQAPPRFPSSSLTQRPSAPPAAAVCPQAALSARLGQHVLLSCRRGVGA